MVKSILYSEISCVCILILLLLSIKVKKSMFLQEQRQLLFAVMISNILFLMLDASWIFVDNNALEITVAINWALNGTYYILSGILGFIWFCYSETVQESKLVRERKYRIAAGIPIVVLIVLTLLSVKTRWLFYIDDQNHYQRGPAYPVQILCSYGYIIFTAAKAFYASFHTEEYRSKKDLRTLSVYVIPTLIAGSLQVVFPGFPILCVGNALGILYVYLTLQEQLISVDPLTRLNNRNQLFQYLSTKFEHPSDHKALYLLMMDVDYFKSINDQYGHVEGDKALKTVASCLMKSCSNRHFFISRYGGDEFVVIGELELTDSIESVCDAIREELKNIEKPYTLALSIGYAKYIPEIKSQQEFIEMADKELYRVKKNRK